MRCQMSEKAKKMNELLDLRSKNIRHILQQRSFSIGFSRGGRAATRRNSLATRRRRFLIGTRVAPADGIGPHRWRGLGRVVLGRQSCQPAVRLASRAASVRLA